MIIAAKLLYHWFMLLKMRVNCEYILIILILKFEKFQEAFLLRMKKVSNLQIVSLLNCKGVGSKLSGSYMSS